MHAHEELQHFVTSMNISVKTEYNQDILLFVFINIIGFFSGRSVVQRNSRLTVGQLLRITKLESGIRFDDPRYRNEKFAYLRAFRAETNKQSSIDSKSCHLTSCAKWTVYCNLLYSSYAQSTCLSNLSFHVIKPCTRLNYSFQSPILFGHSLNSNHFHALTTGNLYSSAQCVYEFEMFHHISKRSQGKTFLVLLRLGHWPMELRAQCFPMLHV